MQNPSVRVNGIDMAYEEVGRGERPLVLVHGFTGCRDDFREQLPELGKLGRTIALDQRGHGGSTNTGDAASYTFAQLVADLHGFLDALQIERCDLLGHSMGGMVTLRFVLAHPRRVASLVLMDTAPGPVDVVPRAALEAGAQIALSVGMAQLADVIRERAASDTLRPPANRALEATMGSEAYWARNYARMTAMDPVAFASLGRSLIEQESLTTRLGTIACPTLVLVGEEDAPFLTAAAEMTNDIPGSKRVTITHAAHSPQLENPRAWYEAVREHLVRVRS